MMFNSEDGENSVPQFLNEFVVDQAAIVPSQPFDAQEHENLAPQELSVEEIKENIEANFGQILDRIPDFYFETLQKDSQIEISKEKLLKFAIDLLSTSSNEHLSFVQKNSEYLSLFGKLLDVFTSAINSVNQARATEEGLENPNFDFSKMLQILKTFSEQATNQELITPEYNNAFRLELVMQHIQTLIPVEMQKKYWFKNSFQTLRVYIESISAGEPTQLQQIPDTVLVRLMKRFLKANGVLKLKPPRVNEELLQEIVDSGFTIDTSSEEDEDDPGSRNSIDSFKEILTDESIARENRYLFKNTLFHLIKKSEELSLHAAIQTTELIMNLCTNSAANEEVVASAIGKYISEKSDSFPVSFPNYFERPTPRTLEYVLKEISLPDLPSEQLQGLVKVVVEASGIFEYRQAEQSDRASLEQSGASYKNRLNWIVDQQLRGDEVDSSKSRFFPLIFARPQEQTKEDPLQKRSEKFGEMLEAVQETIEVVASKKEVNLDFFDQILRKIDQEELAFFLLDPAISRIVADIRKIVDSARPSKTILRPQTEELLNLRSQLLSVLTDIQIDIADLDLETQALVEIGADTEGVRKIRRLLVDRLMNYVDVVDPTTKLGNIKAALKGTEKKANLEEAVKTVLGRSSVLSGAIAGVANLSESGESGESELSQTPESSLASTSKKIFLLLDRLGMEPTTDTLKDLAQIEQYLAISTETFALFDGIETELTAAKNSNKLLTSSELDLMTAISTFKQGLSIPSERPLASFSIAGWVEKRNADGNEKLEYKNLEEILTTFKQAVENFKNKTTPTGTPKANRDRVQKIKTELTAGQDQDRFDYLIENISGFQQEVVKIAASSAEEDEDGNVGTQYSDILTNLRLLQSQIGAISAMPEQLMQVLQRISDTDVFDTSQKIHKQRNEVLRSAVQSLLSSLSPKSPYDLNEDMFTLLAQIVEAHSS